MASAGPQPGDTGPDQEDEDGEAAVEVLGDDLAPARSPGAEQRDEAADGSAATPIATGIRYRFAERIRSGRAR